MLMFLFYGNKIYFQSKSSQARGIFVTCWQMDFIFIEAVKHVKEDVIVGKAFFFDFKDDIFVKHNFLNFKRKYKECYSYRI